MPGFTDAVLFLLKVEYKTILCFKLSKISIGLYLSLNLKYKD